MKVIDFAKKHHLNLKDLRSDQIIKKPSLSCYISFNKSTCDILQNVFNFLKNELQKNNIDDIIKSIEHMELKHRNKDKINIILMTLNLLYLLKNFNIGNFDRKNFALIVIDVYENIFHSLKKFLNKKLKRNDCYVMYFDDQKNSVSICHNDEMYLVEYDIDQFIGSFDLLLYDFVQHLRKRTMCLKFNTIQYSYLNL